MTIISTLRYIRHGPLKSLNPFWIYLGRLYQLTRKALGIQGTTIQKIGPYGPFKMNGEFAFSNFEEWGGNHNNGFVECVEACRDAFCVLDVGAHIGLVTLPISSVVNKDGKVYSFEPASANLVNLKAHIEKNGIRNVEIIDALVGDSDVEQVTFYEQETSTGQNSILQRRKDTALYKETQKRQISLDKFCMEKGLKPQIIKIDVEGAEMMVLEGTRNILRDAKPDVYLSVHPAEIKMLLHELDDLSRLIESLGFDCFEIDGRSVETFRLAEYLLKPKKDNN